MKHLLKYFRPYLLWLGVLLVLVFGQAYVNLTLPDYTAKIVNEGIVSQNLAIIWSNGIQMLILTLIGGLCAVGVGFVAAKIASGYSRRLREALFMNVERFSLGEFNTFSASSLVTRATNDMQQIQNVLYMILRMAFMSPIMGIGSIIKAHQLASSMSWIVVIAISVMLVVIVILFTIAVPKFSLIQKIVDKLSLQTHQMLSGIRVIRAYNNDTREQEKFDRTNLESTRLNIFVNRMMALVQPMMTLIMGLASVAVVWVGSYMIDAGNLQVGDLLALMQYVAQTIMSFLMMSVVFILVPRMAVSGRRVGQVLATEPTIVDPVDPRHLPKKPAGRVTFSDVSFSYSGSARPVLSDISFTAEPGQTTAIIGSTGSGKSTILKLIPRLYDVSVGSITIDGVDIRKLPQTELRQHIGYIPQKAALFSGTISSNISYGKPGISDRKIKQAATIAQASEFIDRAAKGLKSPVAQAGGNISGGQKQRLSIARALAKDPAIYLFDDSFSALDFKTDAALRQALGREVSNATLIIVAQRINTIRYAQKIIVLDEGKIVGMGTHQELLTSSNVYREIAESQLSADELMEKA